MLWEYFFIHKSDGHQKIPNTQSGVSRLEGLTLKDQESQLQPASNNIFLMYLKWFHMKNAFEVRKKVVHIEVVLTISG